jgi:hypothetical protein
VDTTKIVFFGASSISFGLTTIKGVFSPQDLAGSTLTLVDIGEAKLARIPSLLGCSMTGPARGRQSSPDRRLCRFRLILLTIRGATPAVPRGARWHRDDGRHCRLSGGRASGPGEWAVGLTCSIWWATCSPLIQVNAEPPLCGRLHRSAGV